jgi:hypothetical protein
MVASVTSAVHTLAGRLALATPEPLPFDFAGGGGINGQSLRGATGLDLVEVYYLGRFYFGVNSKTLFNSRGNTLPDDNQTACKTGQGNKTERDN